MDSVREYGMRAGACSMMVGMMAAMMMMVMWIMMIACSS
jgi:hypothetical protein